MTAPSLSTEPPSTAAAAPLSPATGPLDQAVVDGAHLVVSALTVRVPEDRDGWLAHVGNCQSLINILTAVQDTAIAEAARRESIWSEDGTLGETVHRTGRVTLDAADVVAPLIGASHPQAQRRVEQAVRLAADRVPVPAETRDLPDTSGLVGLHAAMAQGRLDGYRAGVVAFELEIAPADVAYAVIAALDSHLGNAAARLRQRTRVLLSRISPDLVRERAKRARASTGLRRWVGEPGVDEWHGTFPSEEAAVAWAAIDRLAPDLVAAGTCTNIEQARGKALTDLVTGNANIDVQVVLTVPADATPQQAIPRPGDAASAVVSAATADVPVSPATSAADQADSGTHQRTAATIGPRDDIESEVRADDAIEAERHDSDHPVSRTEVAQAEFDPCTAAPEEPIESAEELVEAHGVLASVTARSDAELLDPRRPPSSGFDEHPAEVRRGPSSEVGGSEDDLVEVQGARPSEPLLVRRAWLLDHLATQPPRPRRGRARPPSGFAPCDPHTGARLDLNDHLSTDAYRPGAELVALVKARDGRCRFPGCSVAARFCDLDHVRPWPTGRTAARNLLTLCRRHHRIKQRPGWRLQLAPDGTATWTDPTGHVRTTAPLNALHTLVLGADPAVDGLRAGTEALRADPAVDGLPAGTEALSPSPATVAAAAQRLTWSALESHLSFRVEHCLAERESRDARIGPTHRRCTCAAALREGFARQRARTPVPDVPPF